MILALKRDFNNIKNLPKKKWPQRLLEIPKPPKQLFIRGELPDTDMFWLAVVGSRKCTDYGKRVCQELIAGLSGYPFVIVSGLAIGIDSVAHKSALDAGIKTVAIPGSGLDDSVLYPRNHRNLARAILENGGCLLSEFENKMRAAPWAFPTRNRIMVGVSHAVLVIEADQKSGTMITARLGTDYNRDVMTVPGSIFSKVSFGPHQLLRVGAAPITSSADILEHFGFEETEKDKFEKTCLQLDFKKEEKMIAELFLAGKNSENISRALKIPIHKVNQVMSLLEINGFTR